MVKSTKTKLVCNCTPPVTEYYTEIIIHYTYLFETGFSRFYEFGNLWYTTHSKLTKIVIKF